MKIFFLAVSVLLNLLYSEVTFAEELKINNAQELINFAKSVNSGNTYSAYTVYLDADIEFDSTLSQQYVPISKFLGIFNGKGHTISNLNVNISSGHVGLFGYSTGLTVQNVIIDSSCSFINRDDYNTYRFVGGFVSCCEGSSKTSTIENCVNMANIAITGNTDVDIGIGGLAGKMYYGSLIKNCANYGTIITSGVGKPVHIEDLLAISTSTLEVPSIVSTTGKS